MPLASIPFSENLPAEAEAAGLPERAMHATWFWLAPATNGRCFHIARRVYQGVRATRGRRRSDYRYLTPIRTPRGSVLDIPRKEVIQPQVLLRLPCYDLVPVTSFTVVASLLAVGSTTSGTPGFHGLTGGVYKAQEHIHRGMLIRDY